MQTEFERSKIMLGDLRKFWFQIANFGGSNVSNTKNNLKPTFLAKKSILLIEKRPKNIEKRKNRYFWKMTPILRGQGVRGGSYDQKFFSPKFVQRDVLRTCGVWGASEKPLFGNLNSKPRGGLPPPPLPADH